MDPSCAICSECFANSDHTGHDYWMFSSGGGCCDCGDVEAWRPEGFCCHHPGPRSSSLYCHACEDLPSEEKLFAETIVDALTGEYLEARRLEQSDEDVMAEYGGTGVARAHADTHTHAGTNAECVRCRFLFC